MGRFWFHGTTKENALKISTVGFFRAGTYFTHDILSAIDMGGPYVFWIWFKEDPSSCWEYISEKNISMATVARIVIFNVEEIHHDEHMLMTINEELLKKQFGNDYSTCVKCGGRGQEEYYPFGYKLSMSSGKKQITVCKSCKGYGRKRRIDK